MAGGTDGFSKAGTVVAIASSDEMILRILFTLHRILALYSPIRLSRQRKIQVLTRPNV